MAGTGGERPDWGADLVEQARQVAAGTFVRGRAGVQRGAPSAGYLEKAGPGRSSAVQPDAPALAISGEAQKVEAGSGEAQKVGRAVARRTRWRRWRRWRPALARSRRSRRYLLITFIW